MQTGAVATVSQSPLWFGANPLQYAHDTLWICLQDHRGTRR